MLNVKKLGVKALSEGISSNQKKTTIVKLKTFHTQHKNPKKSKDKASSPGKSNEVVALLRMTKIVASGGHVDIVNFIGNHECSKTLPSLVLFNDDGAMRAAGTPQEARKTAVVVDAMHAIRHWSFQKDDTFGAIAGCYKHNLLKDVPEGAEIVHFCCDRYSATSL